MSRSRVTVLVAAVTLALTACGSRVAPLAGQNQLGGQIPTDGGVTGALTGSTTGPVVAPTSGTNTPGDALAPPASILKPNCRGGASDTGVTATTIKIGLIASINGPLRGAFNSEVEAVDSYFRAINDAGGICGRRIQLLVRDDNGNGATNLALATKLAEEEKVFAFVGSVSAPDDSGIAKVSKKHKIPDMGFPLTWERTEAPYTFGVPGAVQHEETGEAASGTVWLNQTNGIKQVAIFWLRESEVSVLSAWGFEAAVIKAGKGQVRICHEQPAGVLDNNYTNYVVSMQGHCDPDNGPIAVYTTMENNANIKLARAMQGQGFKPKVFAPTFTSYQPTFISQAQGATEGAYMAMPQIPFERLTQPESTWTPGTRELKRYVDTLYHYYPRPSAPGSFGAPGWGTAALFADTAAFCGAQLTRACVLNRLETRPPFSLNGFLSPNKPGDHTIYTADLLVQVRGGKFVEVRPTDKSGPPGGPDFWDDSELFNWGEFFCANQAAFPNPEDKKRLIRAC